jgi:hypothetical protein
MRARLSQTQYKAMSILSNGEKASISSIRDLDIFSDGKKVCSTSTLNSLIKNGYMKAISKNTWVATEKGLALHDGFLIPHLTQNKDDLEEVIQRIGKLVEWISNYKTKPTDTKNNRIYRWIDELNHLIETSEAWVIYNERHENSYLKIKARDLLKNGEKIE